uniref:Lysophosphatidic acid acyltransferase 1 n=1 Tax=Eimeria falciformis TaxID=84963 RepID=A0A221S602_9EIME|nr:lysophosphatidic acid acyltransferase 1 [Eimeria falciformis]
MEPYKILCFLLTVYFYTVVSITLLISFIVQCVEAFVLFPLLVIKPKLRVVILGQTHLGLMELAYLLCRPFWGKRILRPLPSGVSSKKVIVMVNHTSKVDPWVVGSVLLGIPAMYVIKRALLKVPVAGWAQYMAGCLVVRFTKEKGGWGTEPGAVQEMMKEALKALSDGIIVVVFPEGTRSVTGRLQPFRNGFFRLAAENPDISILPIAMHNNGKLWPVNSSILYPGTSYIAVGDYISAEGLTTEQLRDKTHDAIFDLLKLSPEFDPLRDQPLKEAASERGHGL